MKKLSQKQRQRNKRRAQRGSRSVNSRATFHSHKKRKSPIIVSGPKLSWRKVSFYRDGRTGFAYVAKQLKTPVTLCLQENYEETVSFLKDLRASMAARWIQLKNNPRLQAAVIAASRPGSIPRYDQYWDFARIRKLTPEVALIIAAEFDVFTRSTSGAFNGALEIEKWSPDVVNLLDGIGFFALTGVDPPAESILAGADWKVLRFRSGSVADGTSVKSLLLDLGLRELLDDSAVFDAIAEAITNTKHHAYKSHSLAQPVVEDWWMTGFILPKQRRVSISVWDRGLTIPSTLPSWDRYPRMQRVFRRAFGSDEDMTASHYDGSAIRVAMAAGRTSTNLANRGKGLPLIESIVGLCASGHMRIHSRCGTYERVKGCKPIAHSRLSDLGGTLITWDWKFHAE